ncbi:DUF4374 domain-containing protein [Marinilongibacter aquaticus]|uniref:DUF4374 domain-containing protein n=1 Tax=Marinilongibacter aquaticus TaxID=2975157 RepID=UPI0021BD9A62|nr:DUF4374 domain-containing protein [Marinilongibacter aquaticus]UBM58614.1 DUF4374 domain-containing protein [Marinilongibacter aquaticus]
MREYFKFNSKPSLALIALALTIASCSKSESSDEPDPVVTSEIKYAISNVGGAYPSQTTYIQGLENLELTDLDNSNAAELASFSSQWAYGDAVYLTAFGAPATMNKYTFDAEGKAVSAGKLIVPGANTFSSIAFISDTEGYASVGGGLARLIKFDPSSLQITGEIDLTSITKPSASSIYYLGMKARDGKLFMGVNYFDDNFKPFDSAYVAVIDLAEAKVEKLLADGRTANVFLAGSSVNGFALDGNGDLYIQAQGASSKPSGILRIEKGQTDFDPNYFFDLKEATGKDCSGLYLFDNGLAFTTQIQDPSDAYEINGPNYRFRRINLSQQTDLGELSAALPNIYGSSTSIMRKFGEDSILFVVSSSSENAIYSYGIDDETVAKKVTMSSGTCTGLDELN